MIIIDGSQGEGGGQILRSALALSLVTGKEFKIENIRARRAKPGLMRQHLTAVNAAAAVGNAEVEGASVGSQHLLFRPHGIKAGRYNFAVGTAGSATLVLQTVLPALITADGPSELTLEGGTHNPYAPPFDFLQRAFIPLLNRMGPQVVAKLHRPGFYPAGGGQLSVSVAPAPKLAPLHLMERGGIIARKARAMLAQLPRHIGERELKVVSNRLGWDEEYLVVEEVASSRGPGNVLCIEIESDHVTEIFTGFGEHGVSAEKVAETTIQEVREYLAAGVPVGPHLADQLLLPLALAGGGSFRTVAPTRHTITNAEVIRRFLGVEVTIKQIERNDWNIEFNF